MLQRGTEPTFERGHCLPMQAPTQAAASVFLRNTEGAQGTRGRIFSTTNSSNINRAGSAWTAVVVMNPLAAVRAPDVEAAVPVEGERRRTPSFVESVRHHLHKGDSFGALDKQHALEVAPVSALGIARTAAQYTACWVACAGAAVVASRFGDAAQRATTIRCCLVELAHGLNACVVKETRHWLFSELDSDVFHTLLFLNCAWYLRRFEIWATALFAVVRVLAEHAPTNTGGLVEVKARRRASLERADEASAKRPPSLFGKCLRLSAGYAVWYALSMALLLREHVFDVCFLLTLLWAFPMTLMVASHYLYTKQTWSFLVAHMANLLTGNPALFAVALRLDSGPHLLWSVAT